MDDLIGFIAVVFLLPYVLTGVLAIPVFIGCWIYCALNASLSRSRQ